MYGSSISVSVQICSSFVISGDRKPEMGIVAGATNEAPPLYQHPDSTQSGGTAVYLVFVRNGDFPHSRQAAFELDVIIPQNGHILNPLVAGAVSLRTLQTIVKSKSSVTADQRKTTFTLIPAMNFPSCCLSVRGDCPREWLIRPCLKLSGCACERRVLLLLWQVRVLVTRSGDSGEVS